ncbi:MAG: PAS domain S-box protein [Vicinamibacterales bacterium]
MPVLADPVEEDARLLALHAYGVLDTPHDLALDDLARLAAMLCGTSLAAIGFVDHARVWPKAVVGIEARDLPRAGTCWDLVVSRSGPLVVCDTATDPRTAGTRTEVDGRLVRFFAGAPIRTADGLDIGVLAVFDVEPRPDPPAGVDALAALARQATAQLELRRRADEATARRNDLEEVSERLLRLIQTMKAATIVEDEDRHIVLANTAVARLFGLEGPAEMLVGIDCGDLTEGAATLFADPDAFVSGVRRCLEARVEVFGERLAMADGRTFERDYVPITVADRHRGHLWQYRDITERLSAQADLAASEARWRAVVDHMLEGLVLVRHADGIIRSINPAAERIFGYAPGEIVGRHLGELMPDEPATRSPEFFAQAYEAAIGRTTEWRVRRKSGEVVPVELQLFEFDTSEGQVLAGALRDLTERREIEKLKKQFVSMVSHELRTPLTSISGSLAILESGTTGEISAQGREVISIAQRSITRLVGLVNDLLDLGRLEAGRMEVVPEPMSAALLAERAVESVRAVAAGQGVELVARPDPDLVVLADGDRVVQVLVNLLSNAVKFSPRGARVTLGWAAEGGHARFTVIDRGRGVPLALQQVIFEPFRQSERADALAKGGSGLGLSIARALVQQHHGSIGVTSREGQGATFWFTLPLANEGQEPPARG